MFLALTDFKDVLFARRHIYANLELTGIIKSIMAYDEMLANRIRERLSNLPIIEEKEMMGGLTFMVNDKMCIGVIHDEMMCRIDPAIHVTVIEMTGCRTMDFTKRPMKGWVMIDNSGMRTPGEFEYWINLALEFNVNAKSSRKKK
jgi:TfoX/Sxy family transcriptional regulator of competence genes